ncbi:MAG: type IV secretion system protein TraC [Gammaproteobacteria bacterium]
MLNRMTEYVSGMGEKVARLAGDYTPKMGIKTHKKADIKNLFDHHMMATLLPYESYDEASGLFINKKSIGFVLEASTLIGSSEEIENILSSIITDTLPPTADMQFLLWASPKIEPILDAFYQHRSKNETFVWLAQKRIDYLRKGTKKSLSSSGSLLLRNFRLFITVSIPKKFGSVDSELIGLRDDLESSLKSINMATKRLNAEEFISVLSDVIIPKSDLSPTDYRWNEHDSLSLQLTDSEWNMQILPNSLMFSSENEKIDVRCLTVREFPQKATQWKVTENLGQMLNSTLQIPCSFLVSFSLRKINQEKAVANSQMISMNRESTAKSPLAKFKPSVNREYEDWYFVKQRLADGDSLVKTFYQITLFSDPEEANSNEKRVRDLYRANGWKLRKESFLQLQTWLAGLPMMMSEGLFDDLKYFGRLKTMTAFNAVNIAPIQGEWKGTKTPSLILPGRRGQIATWNPFDNEGGNYNISIVAAPGKGKSALVQEYIVATLGAHGTVQVIDQGHSQQKTCKLLGGEFIEFSPDSPICLNPFTHITDLDESIMMLKPLIANMARPVRGATEEELSSIEQAIKGAYEREGNDSSITTVANWLSERQDEICKNLSHLLYSYTKEGIYSRFFEGKSTVDFSNPFVVMELQDLKSRKELRKIVLQLLIYQISQKMYHSDRNQIKSCIIDEAWDLFDDDNITSAKFIEAGYRTARKFRGNFISIAHSIGDFHKNPMSRAAFDCSDFKIILGQTDEAINKLKQDKIMDIDGFTERLLKSLKITKDFSECMIKSPEGMSIHRVIFDPYSRILYSTKGEEFEAVNQLMMMNGNDPEYLPIAVEIVARRFNYV